MSEPGAPPAADTTPAEAELRDAILAGDRAAFTELYEQHAEKVWNYAYRLTGSWSQADDLLSVVFLTAWRRRRDLRLVGGSALPWLYVVTGNVCRRERRGMARFLKARLRLLTPAAPDHADRVVERDAAAARLAQVLAAVDRLPRALREAVQLCLLGGASAEDAAQILGITVHSVQSRLSRARARLHQSVPEE
ncbi:RNA polymerase sigma factor [Catenuloplanes atrovinosus]|nr:RNA polymerase sigma factor [Catenuloplanes atrovinosus]